MSSGKRQSDDTHADAAGQGHRWAVEEREVGQHAGPVRPEVERERLAIIAWWHDAVEDSHENHRDGRPADVVGERNALQFSRSGTPTPVTGSDHLWIEEEIP